MERLIPELIHRGLKVATVKHDGHSFEPDSPGTDSYRFWQAGVSASIIYDNDKYSVVKREPLQESAIAGLVGDADLSVAVYYIHHKCHAPFFKSDLVLHTYKADYLL